MVDLKGIQYRLALNTEKSAREIQEEFDSNQWESREGLKYAGAIVAWTSSAAIFSIVCIQKT